MIKSSVDIKALETLEKRFRDDKARWKVVRGMAKELKELLREMLIYNTPVKSGELEDGWGDAGSPNYKIRKINNGYKITLYNDCEYASYVNYGHYSRNQVNGKTETGLPPWTVYNRIVTPTPHVEFGASENDKYVYGTFFIERTLLEFDKSHSELDAILQNEVDKYIGWCFGGK